MMRRPLIVWVAMRPRRSSEPATLTADVQADAERTKIFETTPCKVTGDASSLMAQPALPSDWLENIRTNIDYTAI